LLNGEVIRKIYAKDSPSVADLTLDQHLFLTYWAPKDSLGAEGFNAATMPYYCQFDWLEVYSWEESSNTYVLDWRDDFTGANGASVANDNLAVWNNVSGGNNDRTEKVSSNVYIYDNTMTI